MLPRARSLCDSYDGVRRRDQFFAKEAEASTRQGADWDFGPERAALQATMGELATRTKRTIDVQLKAAQQQSKCIQLIQMYQQQLQQLQQQAFGQASSALPAGRRGGPRG